MVLRGLLAPPAALDAYDKRLDAAVNEPFVPPTPPPILYHYTTWGGLEGILGSRTFRATAHGSTNDPKELRAAEAIACQVAQRLGNRLGWAGKQLMLHFCKWYPKQTLSQRTTIFLCCFSSARDERIHWEEYAQGGSGVCIGLKVLRSETLPDAPNLGRAIMQVNYDRSSWEDRIERGFRNVASEYERFLIGALDRERPIARDRALGGLARVAGMAALNAKEDQWRDEKEWRYTAMWWRGAAGATDSYTRVDGTRVECLLLPMRAPGRLLVLDEVIIGPRETEATAEIRVREILAKAGYPSGDAPIPPISRSRAAAV